jgi:hypothetical protein
LSLSIFNNCGVPSEPSLFYYCCAVGTFWSLQKFFQYIIVEFPPPSFSLFPPITGIVLTVLFFPFTYMCTQYWHHIHSPKSFPCILSLLTSTNSPSGTCYTLLFGDHYVKWGKTGSERQRLHAFSLIWKPDMHVCMYICVCVCVCVCVEKEGEIMFVMVELFEGTKRRLERRREWIIQKYITSV